MTSCCKYNFFISWWVTGSEQKNQRALPIRGRGIYLGIYVGILMMWCVVCMCSRVHIHTAFHKWWCVVLSKLKYLDSFLMHIFNLKGKLRQIPICESYMLIITRIVWNVLYSATKTWIVNGKNVNVIHYVNCLNILELSKLPNTNNYFFLDAV